MATAGTVDAERTAANADENGDATEALQKKGKKGTRKKKKKSVFNNRGTNRSPAKESDAEA